MRAHVGTARWNIPAEPALRTDPRRKREGTLAQYARLLGASEVNSSFYRHHDAATWARWARSTPSHFRFSLKLSRAVTHDAQLDPDVAADVLARLRGEVAPLGDRLGPLLVQLPPSGAFDRGRVAAFADALEANWVGAVVVEPRHPSWFTGPADELLAECGIGRVAADPERAPGAAQPGGSRGLLYVRLHGSPRTYHSAYGPDRIAQWAGRILEWAEPASECWCTFDNTASGAALDDAILMQRLLGGDPGHGDPPPEPPGPRFRIISST